MPLHQADGVVLTRYAFQERDWVVVLLTPSAGQVRLVARRVRTVRGGVAQAGAVAWSVSATRAPGSELGTCARRCSDARRCLAGAPRRAAAQVGGAGAPPPPAGPAGRRAVPARRPLSRAFVHRGDALIVAHYAELWFLRLGILPGPDRCGRCERPPPPARWWSTPPSGCSVLEHRPPTGTGAAGRSTVASPGVALTPGCHGQPGPATAAGMARRPAPSAHRARSLLAHLPPGSGRWTRRGERAVGRSRFSLSGRRWFSVDLGAFASNISGSVGRA